MVGSEILKFLFWNIGRLTLYFSAFALYAISIRSAEAYTAASTFLSNNPDSAASAYEGKWVWGYQLASWYTWLTCYSILLVTPMAATLATHERIIDAIEKRFLARIRQAFRRPIDLGIYAILALFFVFEISVLANIGSLFLSGLSGGVTWN